MCVPCVRSCCNAGITASPPILMAARVSQRLSQGDVSPISSGWTTVRPAASRGMTQTSCLPPTTNTTTYMTPPPPPNSSLFMVRRLFSGRRSILCDGAVEEGRRRGMEWRGNDRHTRHTERRGHQQDDGKVCDSRIMVQ